MRCRAGRLMRRYVYAKNFDSSGKFIDGWDDDGWECPGATDTGDE